MPRKAKTNASPEASANTEASTLEGKQPTAMTMADMAAFTSDGSWLTLSEATSYANRSKATIRSAFKSYPEIFSDQAVRLIEIKGTGYPPLLYIAKTAIDEYTAKRDATPDGVTRQRASRGNGRKYTVYIPDTQIEAAKAWATSQGFELKLAFSAKPKANGTAEQPATNDQAPASAPELELVSA